MNLYRNKKNKQLYTITHSISKGEEGIYAQPWNHPSATITHLSKNVEECVAFVKDNFILAGHKGPKPDNIFKNLDLVGGKSINYNSDFILALGKIGRD